MTTRDSIGEGGAGVNLMLRAATDGPRAPPFWLLRRNISAGTATI
jgi:hypothetical protein